MNYKFGSSIIIGGELNLFSRIIRLRYSWSGVDAVEMLKCWVRVQVAMIRWFSRTVGGLN